MKINFKDRKTKIIVLALILLTLSFLPLFTSCYLSGCYKVSFWRIFFRYASMVFFGVLAD
ncbi:hypothetical protein JXC34_05595 [Candidatus Woesearchaeota archaeon]|nr:hypothetical protein [Candidatus Woesearchaeota archaeon]